MSDLWTDWEDQTVTIRPLLGSGGMGPVYGAAVEVLALVEERSQLVRAADASEVTSSATVHAPPGTVAPAGSLVQLPTEATERKVIKTATHRADDSDLEGVEVMLE